MFIISKLFWLLGQFARNYYSVADRFGHGLDWVLGLRTVPASAMSWLYRLDYQLASLVIQLPSPGVSLFVETDTPDGDRNDDCTICLGRLERGQKLLTHVTCKNSWHRNCVGPWLAKQSHQDANCPQCRGPAHAPSRKANPKFRSNIVWYPALIEVVSNRYRVALMAFAGRIALYYSLFAPDLARNMLVLWDSNRIAMTAAHLEIFRLHFPNTAGPELGKVDLRWAISLVILDLLLLFAFAVRSYLVEGGCAWVLTIGIGLLSLLESHSLSSRALDELPVGVRVADIR